MQSDVLAHVQAKSLLRSEVDPPVWLEGCPRGFHADECLATKSRIVHLPSLVAGREPNIVPSGPAFFTPSACEFDIDLNAQEPATWLNFLNVLWGDDQASVNAFQELFGYSLTADTRRPKVFIVVGPKRSGKGTIAHGYSQA